MKKSQLVQLIREEIRGYSKYAPGGVTKGGTSDDFMNILTAIAKEPAPYELPDFSGDLEKGRQDASVKRGNKILDKANPDNVARITRGEKPIYEGEGQLYSKDDAIAYIENNRGAKYYKIGISQGIGQTVTDAAKAIDVVRDSPILQFELTTYGDVIQFSAPYSKKHGDAVRGMGRLD
jgi:hypothetical protein